MQQQTTKAIEQNTDTDTQATTTTSLQPNANWAALDTIDSDDERWYCQVLSRAWPVDVMAWSITMYWWLLGAVALTAAALIVMVNLLLLGWLTYYELKQTQSYYIPKQAHMPKSQWIKAYLKSLKDASGKWLSGLMTTRTK